MSPQRNLERWSIRTDTWRSRVGAGLVIAVAILFSGARASHANIVTEWNAMAVKTVAG